MILVVGLAVAGVAGIAAAFYFTIRAGSGKKVSYGPRYARAAGAGADRFRAGRLQGTGRLQGSRTGGIARAGRAANARRAANGGGPANASRGADLASRNYLAEESTGPQHVMDFGNPETAGGRSRPFVAARPGQQVPDIPAPAFAAGDAEKTARPRRRVGFRKGADVDEEIWPTESFGGVTDEQFWDDLASDKPLTTTARTAQDSVPRNRPLDSAPQPGTRQGRGGYPGSRPGPDTANDRTMIQPAYATTQPSKSPAPLSKSPAPLPKSPAPLPKSPAPPPKSPAPLPQGATQPVRAAKGLGQPVKAAAQPEQTRGRPPEEPSGRRRAGSGAVGADEDPLTSAAFSLRASGPVDGHSSLRAAERPHGDSSPAAQPTDTPPYGEAYGYGNGRGSSAAQADDAGRQSGPRSQARPGANTVSEGNRPAQQAYPRGGGYPAGGYPAGGHQKGGYPAAGYQGNAYQGYQVSGHQGNGHPNGSGQDNGYQDGRHQTGSYRAPHDPRDDYRRLVRQR